MEESRRRLRLDVDVERLDILLTVDIDIVDEAGEPPDRDSTGSSEQIDEMKNFLTLDELLGVGRITNSSSNY